MTILYCDCFSGISGDMFLAALCDLGLPKNYLTDQLARLNLAEFEGLDVRKVMKGPLQATSIEFHLHEVCHDHHHHRNLTDISKIIGESSLPAAVQKTSLAIFTKLAGAEARVHGQPVDEVHFHEVGAADSILDIIGAAIGLHFLGNPTLYSSSLPLGQGSVQTQHGLLPLPAPATLELLQSAGAPVHSSSAQAELVTPTGAAILATLATFTQPDFTIRSVGTGAGKRDFPWPNILRVMLGEESGPVSGYVEIETNIDDLPAQVLGHVMQLLLNAGALDVYFTPIQMKKDRPAVKLSVIAHARDEIALSRLMLAETSTLGVRVHPVHRHEAQREEQKIATPYGEISIKIKRIDGQIARVQPEYEDCLRLAQAAGVPLIKVLEEAAALSLEWAKRQ